MPMEVLQVTKEFMRDPLNILVKKEELTLEGIKQFYVAVDKEVRKPKWKGKEIFLEIDVILIRYLVVIW